MTHHPKPTDDPNTSPDGSQQTAELVVLNRTTSFPRIVYEFTELSVPESASTTAKATIESSNDVTRLMAKFSVLLSRSSGRDKVAALFQYASLFWGDQPFMDVSGIKDDNNAPWVKLHESMSSGRKVFRLFKWIKEFERMRKMASSPPESMSVATDKTTQSVVRVLAVLMHFFSSFYYFIDNVIWASQVRLINRPNLPTDVQTVSQYQKYLDMVLPYEKYMQVQNTHQQITKAQSISKARVKQWRDWKNWSSLGRLILAIAHSIIQLRLLAAKRDRILQEQESRSLDSDTTGSQDEDDEDPLEVISETQSEQLREMWVALFNLGILLQRLKFPIFRSIPTWGIGMFGMGAAYLGIEKNWPSEVHKKKKSKKKQA